MKIEIEHAGSCLGATGGTGRLTVRDALAKGHSVVALVRSKARALGSISVLRATGCVYCTPWALILLAEALARRAARLTTNFETAPTLLQRMSLLLADTVAKVHLHR